MENGGGGIVGVRNRCGRGRDENDFDSGVQISFVGRVISRVRGVR